MAISFVCECGKALKARDELAGKKTRCPQCQAVLEIPRAGPDDEAATDEFEPMARPASPSADSPASAAEGVSTRFRPAPARPAPSKAPAASKARSGGDGGASLREYSHLLLAFALVPLIVSLLGKDEKPDLQARFARSIARASPEERTRIEGILSSGEVSLDDALAALPGGKLDGAHLARNTAAHWVYAGVAAAAFLLLLLLFFSVERASPAHLLGIGAFTGTVGIIFLLLVQSCSNFRLRGIHGRGIMLVILLILTFIGWSYDSANDPGSNFLLSALGFTFGVGLCEEFTKAIPLFFYFKRDGRMGWRGACLWGLASGIGFGVSEGIMYAGRYYNGLGGADIYLVRFVSCVALHAMWSGSVGIAIARNVEDYEQVDDAPGFGLFLLKVLAVPMVLHGFYDTLLKKDMNLGALGVALLSFAWFAAHIEMARGSHPGEGRAGTLRRPSAY